MARNPKAPTRKPGLSNTAFNAISRSVMLRRMAEQPRLAHLVPFMHALLHAPTDLFCVGGAGVCLRVVLP